jgi:RNA polymerase sigma-70 factor (ECF subfamily)
MLRRQMASKEQLVAEDLWPVLELQVETDLVADTGENQVLTRQLELYIHRLPVPQQEVVRGIYLQDLTLQELAERLDVPLGTIKSRLRLALEKLREQIGHADD